MQFQLHDDPKTETSCPIPGAPMADPIGVTHSLVFGHLDH
jgi:hypothetical protein